MSLTSRHPMNTAFRILLGALAFPAAFACHRQAPNQADNSIRAIAYVVDSLGREVGIVRFTEVPGTPGVTIDIAVERGATPIWARRVRPVPA